MVHGEEGKEWYICRIDGFKRIQGPTGLHLITYSFRDAQPSSPVTCYSRYNDNEVVNLCLR